MTEFNQNKLRDQEQQYRNKQDERDVAWTNRQQFANAENIKTQFENQKLQGKIGAISDNLIKPMISDREKVRDFDMQQQASIAQQQLAHNNKMAELDFTQRNAFNQQQFAASAQHTQSNLQNQAALDQIRLQFLQDQWKNEEDPQKKAELGEQIGAFKDAALKYQADYYNANYLASLNSTDPDRLGLYPRYEQDIAGLRVNTNQNYLDLRNIYGKLGYNYLYNYRLGGLLYSTKRK